MAARIAEGRERLLAEKHLSRATRIDPSRPEAWLARVDLFLAQESMAAAAALSPAYRGSLAAFYEAQGRVADAEALYTELGQAPEDDVFAHLAVADYLFRSGRLDDAAQTYQQILEAGSAPPGLVTSLVHFALGQIEYLQERLFAAGGEFDQALAAFPANVDAQAGLGDLALRAGEAADALAAYDAALPLVPQYMGGLPAENVALTNVLLQVRRSLALAIEHKITSIAFPAISCGVYGYPREQAAAIAVHSLSAELVHAKRLRRVILVAYQESMAEILRSALAGSGAA